VVPVEKDITTRTNCHALQEFDSVCFALCCHDLCANTENGGAVVDFDHHRNQFGNDNSTGAGASANEALNRGDAPAARTYAGKAEHQIETLESLLNL
jgi:hypothetical protein